MDGVETAVVPHSEFGIGLVCCAVAALGFGSNYLPLKKVDCGDGFFFAACMAVGIFIVGILVNYSPMTATGFFQGPRFQPLAMLGGVAWMAGNLMTPTVIRLIGLGLGLSVWDLSNMIMGWATGYFGLFGVWREHIAKPWLNLLGLSFAGCSLLLLAQSVAADLEPQVVDEASKVEEDCDEEAPGAHVGQPASASSFGVADDGQVEDEVGASGAVLGAGCGGGDPGSRAVAAAAASSRGQGDEASDCNSDLEEMVTLDRDGVASLIPNFSTSLPVTAAAPPPASAPVPEEAVSMADEELGASASPRVGREVGGGVGVDEAGEDGQGEVERAPSVALAAAPETRTSSRLKTSSLGRPIEDLTTTVASHEAAELDYETASSSDSSGGWGRIEGSKSVGSMHGSAASQLQMMRLRRRRVLSCVLGFGMALLTGTLFGWTFDTSTVLLQDALQGDTRYSPNNLDYVLSNFTGIVCAGVGSFLVYLCVMRQHAFVRWNIVGPGIASGMLWGVAQAAWFKANQELTIVVAFPIISALPGMVALFWGVLFFGELRSPRSRKLAAVAMAMRVPSVVLIALSDRPL